jgi:3-methylfumaryl-CoA hydratase
MSVNIDDLRRWVGKEETSDDVATAVPVAALAATLDRDERRPQTGDPLPPLWHWLYFLPIYPISRSGPDGHPRAANFCRRCRCRGGCGQAAASNSIDRCV